MSLSIGRGRIGFVDRLKTGWVLTKDSLGVVRDHPRLRAEQAEYLGPEGEGSDTTRSGS